MNQWPEPGSVAVADRGVQRDLLASDADREAVAGLLSSAFAEGRLTADEHAERVRAAFGARSLGELGALTADLPASSEDHPGREKALVNDGLKHCVRCALLICCPPVGIVWLLAARRRARTGGGADAESR